jgi:hypothetical protein
VREAPGRLSERPHHVEVRHDKRPCDGDGSDQESSLSGTYSWARPQTLRMLASRGSRGTSPRTPPLLR